MICDLDIKFVNKEITPSGGLSLFFQMLEKCHFEEWLKRCGIPFQGLNRDYQPLRLIMGLFAGVNFRKKEFLKTIRYDMDIHTGIFGQEQRQTYLVSGPIT